jgi:N-methylhydantoinase B/oxoprolinase/acetone carboxylase alpha subunit
MHPESNDYYADYHFEVVGWGASSFRDGNNAVVVPNGNCRNTPVEVFETRFPFLTQSYSLVPDSGGAGTFRGGLGVKRLLTVTAPEITLSAVFERMRVRPWGLFGGKEASLSALMIRRRGDTEFRTFEDAFGTISPAKFVNILIQEGDEILLQSPGGGGFGDPARRPPEAVLHDVRERFVSPEAARRDYLVTIRRGSGGYSLDPEQTVRLRDECRGPS